MQKQLGIPADAHWALVTLSTPAMPDDLIATAASHDASGRNDLEANFSDILTGHFAGGEWQADAAHSHLIAVTNGGTKPTEALLTLHYNSGQRSYEMQQTIQPGDQMLVSVADLIHSSVADRKGNVLPADLTSGTFEVKDLSASPGSLTESSLAVDKTAGSQVIPYSPQCCGYYDDAFQPSPIDVPVNGFDYVDITGIDQCNQQPVDLSSFMNSWSSGNTTIAQVTARQVQGVTPGITVADASGPVAICKGNRIYFQTIYPTAPVVVNACPASVTLAGTSAESLARMFPGTMTGVGAMAKMQASPSTTNWNGSQLTEQLPVVSTTCPANWAQSPLNLCKAGTTPFTVGGIGPTVNGVDGETFTNAENTFYDEHVWPQTTSVLPSSQNGCQFVCAQQYLCGGTVRGTFTITFTFTHGTIQSTPVTNIVVTKK